MLKEKATLEATVGGYDRTLKGLEDAEVLAELANEADDEASHQEALDTLVPLEAEVQKLELARMLCGEQDHASCFMDINAGAGGTDSMDWAAMLLRMYTRYCEQKGWKVEINDAVEGEEAGFKNVSLRIEGENAYGYLKAEVGVHRLVRISPFDGNARRQTAFASVDVYPEVDDSIEIDLPEKDYELKFIRGGGSGGQKVNKTSSTAQLRHLPTGIIITMPDRALAVPEPGDGVQDPARPALRAGDEEAPGAGRGGRGGEEGHLLRQPDPLLRPRALPDGQGPAHRNRDRPGGPRPRRRRSTSS